jgi:hypothetical protein
MLNLTTTASKLSGSESLTASCPMPPSLAISAHSLVKGTPQAIREWLMSSPVDSLVSRFPTQESDLEQTIPATCGPQLSNVSASYDPDMRCWKMSQGWLLADISGPSWETWPKAGYVLNGAFYPQPNWERRISEIGSGLLPTPNADMGDATNKLIPHGGHFRRPSGHKAHLRLTESVKMWRTPSASVIEPKSNVVKLTGRTPQDPQVGLADQVGGQLNPDWVEWLMGWPIGWTSLEPLPADNFSQWLDAVTNGTWWPNEPDIPRVAKGITNRVDRLKALGNGQVSAVVAAAWQLLTTA